MTSSRQTCDNAGGTCEATRVRNTVSPLIPGTSGDHLTAAVINLKPLVHFPTGNRHMDCRRLILLPLPAQLAPGLSLQHLLHKFHTPYDDVTNSQHADLLALICILPSKTQTICSPMMHGIIIEKKQQKSYSVKILPCGIAAGPHTAPTRQ